MTKQKQTKKMGTVLVVDDEDYVRDSLALVLARQGYSVRTAASAAEALEPDMLDGLDGMITDLKMPGVSGLELLKKIKQRKADLPVLVLTAHGNVSSAVECIKAGAFEFLEKPADMEELLQVMRRALDESSRNRELEYLRTKEGSERRPLGCSPSWKKIIEIVEAAAPTDASVLILGESGTGKEEVARLIHRKSHRSDRPFVSVNCGAIPLELFESEFFGHCKGAFTGASRDRQGRFRVAHTGTLFLDEISCLPESAQSKVLRVLEEGTFERVGESRSTSVDVRLVSATNSDIEADVETGRFRQDLLYRINVFTIHIPPLRERTEDIALLANAFVKEFGLMTGRAVRRISDEAMAMLREYRWPGNIRELRNVIERAVILEKESILTPVSLPENIQMTGTAGEQHRTLNLRESLKHEERRLLQAALDEAGGVKREAARLLGIDERNLSYFLKKHDLAEGKSDQ
ncbi:MAG: sigma-54-dependent Fis family transcriptional regulator [Acidobacteriota bacterium]|nr:MAG: sigma-54-dependent Fis family transcriptional regulator [Acidobacteriota bacterium]